MTFTDEDNWISTLQRHKNIIARRLLPNYLRNTVSNDCLTADEALHQKVHRHRHISGVL